jgi:hypothetical protein
VKFVDEEIQSFSKPATSKSAKTTQSRGRASPQIFEDESIKHVTGREEETYGDNSVNEMKSNSRGNSRGVSKSQSTKLGTKSVSKIPKLSSRNNSDENIDPRSSNVQSSYSGSRKEMNSEVSKSRKSEAESQPELPAKSNASLVS